jgi:hypothetical protein
MLIRVNRLLARPVLPAARLTRLPSSRARRQWARLLFRSLLRLAASRLPALLSSLPARWRLRPCRPRLLLLRRRLLLLTALLPPPSPPPHPQLLLLTALRRRQLELPRPRLLLTALPPPPSPSPRRQRSVLTALPSRLLLPAPWPTPQCRAACQSRLLSTPLPTPRWSALCRLRLPLPRQVRHLMLPSAPRQLPAQSCLRHYVGHS